MSPKLCIEARTIPLGEPCVYDTDCVVDAVCGPKDAGIGVCITPNSVADGESWSALLFVCLFV